MRMGVHENITPLENEQKYPGVSLERVFIPGVISPQDLRQKFQRLCQSYWDAGLTPLISFKPRPAEVADGKWDVHLSELGSYLNDKSETWVSFYHEPEDNLNGPTFNSMFTRCHENLKRHGPEVKTVYSAMAYQWRPGSSTTKDSWNWKPKADYYACDVYSGRSFPLTDTLTTHAGFKRWKQHLPVDQAWGLSERGFETRTNFKTRSETLRSDILIADGMGASFYIYWNTPGTEGSDDLVLYPAEEETLRQAISDATGSTKVCGACMGTGRVPR